MQLRNAHLLWLAHEECRSLFLCIDELFLACFHDAGADTVSDFERLCLFDQVLLKFLGNALKDNDSFCREAKLSVVEVGYSNRQFTTEQSYATE